MFEKSIIRKLRPSERLVAIINTHWITNIISPRFLFMLDVVLVTILSIGLFVVPLPLESKFILIFVLIGLSLWLIAKCYEVTANRLIITDQRVINIAQKSTFRKVVDEHAYPSVQNVTYEVRGLFNTILNLGSVIIVAFGGKIILNRMKNPENIQNLILDLRDKASSTRVKPETSIKGKMYDGLRNKQLLKLVENIGDASNKDEKALPDDQFEDDGLEEEELDGYSLP